MRLYARILVSGTAVVAAFGLNPAQAQLALEMEGPITGYSGNGPGVRPTVEVMGVPVTIERNTVLTSPTTTRADAGLGIGQWFRGARFPGRSQRGFLGGTATVTGTIELDGTITAEEIFAEPAENVIVGVISDATCVTPTCNTVGETITAIATATNPGVVLVALTDASTNGRMAFDTPSGEFGFPIDLTAAPLDGLGLSVEGYYSDAATGVPTLYFFALEVADGGALLANPEVYEVAATRAQCRQRDVGEFELEVRGNTHIPVSQDGLADPASGVIGLLDQNGAPVPLEEVAEIGALAEDGDPNIFGGFRIRIDEGAGSCPNSVTVTWSGADGQAGTAASPASEVDVRDDTAG